MSQADRKKLDILFFEAARSDGLSDQEVIEALEAEGVDIEKSSSKMKQRLAAHFAAARRTRLDTARTARERLRPVQAIVQMVHSLDFSEVNRRISEIMSGGGEEIALAHRELQGQSEEDKRSLLIDLLTAQQSAKAEDDDGG